LYWSIEVETVFTKFSSADSSIRTVSSITITRGSVSSQTEDELDIAVAVEEVTTFVTYFIMSYGLYVESIGPIRFLQENSLIIATVQLRNLNHSTTCLERLYF